MKLVLIVAFFSTLVMACRRQDVRECSFDVPWLNDANKVQVVSALSKYAGVDASSLRFDVDKKTVTLKYDSMQVAQANIRAALEAESK
jgi:hypothetical protein